MKKLLTAALAYLAVTSSLLAGLSLPTIFSDHMMLQREQAAPVWGTADPGAKGRVEAEAACAVRAAF